MLKKLFIILTILFSYTSANEKPTLGYLERLSTVTKYDNSLKALNIVANDILNEIGVDFNIKDYSDFDSISKVYNNGEIDVITLDLREYLKGFKKVDDNTSIYVTLPDMENRRLDKLYLLVNKDSNINSLKDLKNKSLALRNGEILSQAYMNIIKKDNKLKYKNVKYFDNYNTIVLKTFFNNFDACIVPSGIYETIKELSPTIKTKLIILDKTENIYIPNIMLSNEKEKNNTINMVQKIKNNEKKEELFSLLSITDIFILEDYEVEKIKQFYLKSLK